MDNLMQNPAVEVAALLFIIKILWEYIKELKSKKKDSSQKTVGSDDQFKRDFYDMKNEVRDLHEWHNKEDADGRKIWYMKQSFETNMIEMNENMKEMTLVLKGLTNVIQRIDSD